MRTLLQLVVLGTLSLHDGGVFLDGSLARNGADEGVAALSEESPAQPALPVKPPTDLPLPACGDTLPDVMRASWIRPRPAGASTGTAFATRTRGWTGRARQQAALEELRKGNIPDFLRTLKPVRLQYLAHDGSLIRATIWVSPDYLSIGSNDDYLRIPLTRPSAVTIAAELGFVLPTRKIVDAIHKQADFRCTPRPIPPGPMMRSSEVYIRHNRMIEEQLEGQPLGELVSGQKKDVVLTDRLLGQERIAIYGWHQKDGKPIQGLSTVHGARYADYSHGVRLVYATVCINGEARSIYDVLEDPKLGPVLSYEGYIKRVRQIMRWRR